jgi:hypothetical protein
MIYFGVKFQNDPLYGVNLTFFAQISKKKSESIGQTLPQLPWKQKMGDLK